MERGFELLQRALPDLTLDVPSAPGTLAELTRRAQEQKLLVAA